MPCLSQGNDLVFYLNGARLSPDPSDPMVDQCTRACSDRGYDHAVRLYSLSLLDFNLIGTVRQVVVIYTSCVLTEADLLVMLHAT